VRSRRVVKTAKFFESRNPSDARVSIEVRISISRDQFTDIQGSRSRDLSRQHDAGVERASTVRQNLGVPIWPRRNVRAAGSPG